MDKKIVDISVIIVTHNRKKEVKKCLNSVFRSEFSNFNVVLVDNNSNDGTFEYIQKIFFDKIRKGKLKIVKAENNLYAAEGRNFGSQFAEGEYLLFIDSDNVIDKKMIGELYKYLKENQNTGLAGPKTYYYSHPNHIWFFGGAKINMFTSKSKYKFNKKKNNNFDSPILSDHLLNIMMIRKSLFESIGKFDKYYKIMFEEADLGEKVRNEGLNIYSIPNAKAYHDINYKRIGGLRDFGIGGTRTFLILRNRAYFIMKYGKYKHKLIYMLIFHHIFFVIYTIIIIKYCTLDRILSEEKNLIKGYLEGINFINYR